MENRRLILGHKQIEENPWDVFESVLAVDSIHKGTIINANEKGGIIALPYGVEGFCHSRALLKEDKTTGRADDVLDFKVLEFSKDTKKILVSHTKTWQDAINAAKDKEGNEEKKKEEATSKVVKKMKENLEKTTLGDIEALVNLKSDMEQTERDSFDKRYKEKEKKKAAKADAAEEAAPEAPEEVTE